MFKTEACHINFFSQIYKAGCVFLMVRIPHGAVYRPLRRLIPFYILKLLPFRVSNEIAVILEHFFAYDPTVEVFPYRPYRHSHLQIPRSCCKYPEIGH